MDNENIRTKDTGTFIFISQKHCHSCIEDFILQIQSNAYFYIVEYDDRQSLVFLINKGIPKEMILLVESIDIRIKNIDKPVKIIVGERSTQLEF